MEFWKWRFMWGSNYLHAATNIYLYKEDLAVMEKLKVEVIANPSLPREVDAAWGIFAVKFSQLNSYFISE